MSTQSPPSSPSPSAPRPAAARRGLWRSPIFQFVVAGLLALVVLLVGTQWLSREAATDEAIQDARTTTRMLAKAVVEPALTRGLVEEQSAALDKFDRVALRSVVGSEDADILRVKIWDENGRIVYSDKTQLIGEQFELGEDELEVLRDGGTEAEVSDLSEPENRYEKDFGRLLEVYTQVWTPQGEPLLFEAYYSYDEVSERSKEVLSGFRPITIAALLLFMLLTVPLMWVLTRRLDASAAERERLLLAAVRASENERRRIARDLHDGVVQDLAGISFAASATARDVADRPEVARRLEALGAGVRASLRALRSLLVEIYPPDLRTEGLAAALDDLLAPATASGVQVTLDVADTAHVREEAVALVWRVAQEAVRNALRHGRPAALQVRVDIDADRVRLVVADDGTGFDVRREPREGHLGLRAMRDLVAETGGLLDVRSAPGAGTTVTLEVAQ